MAKVLDGPTIKISKDALKKGVVILELDRYRRLELADKKEKAPVRYLKGRASEKLDRIVNEGLKEYKSGKAKPVYSLADLR